MMNSKSKKRGTCCVMYTETIVFHVIWLMIQAALFAGGYLKQKNDPGLSRLNDPLQESVFISRGSGLVLHVDCMLILLPICRTLISMVRTWWLNKIIPFDKATWFHKQVAISMLVFTIVHVVGHLFNLWKLNLIKMYDPYYILFQHPAGLTGLGMLWCMFLMYTAALPSMRHRRFEIFYYTHHLAFPFMLFICLHGTGCFVRTGDGICRGYETYKYATFGIAVYVLERILRFWRSQQHTFISKVICHPSKVVEIQFRKQGMHYRSGQYVFLQFPSISKYQWHPFTLTSAPEEDFASVHIRVVGDWTTSVAQRLGCLDSQGNPMKEFRKVALPPLSVDGPFGTPSEDVFKYSAAVVIGAGIGVTPYASVLKSIWYRLSKNNGQPMKLKKVYFIWVCRDKESFEWFSSLLTAMEEDTPQSFLEIQIYLTGGVQMDELQRIVVNNDATQDPTTKLRQRTHYGRPNFQLLFSNICDTVKRPNDLWNYGQGDKMKEVGVFFCGPKAIDRQLREVSHKNSRDNVRFVYHKENF